MSDNSHRQAELFELDDDSLRNGNGQARKPKASKAGVRAEELKAYLQVVLGEIHERLSSLELVLKALSERIDSNPPAKDYYTTLEVARVLQKKPYTVREWCRLGRIEGEKAHSGRGLDEEWRISHQELIRIQNEGLLPIEKFSRVSSPTRLVNKSG